MSSYVMILRSIAERSLRFIETIFSHERREANGEAHRLAWLATTLGVGRYIWLEHPPANLCIPVNIII